MAFHQIERGEFRGRSAMNNVVRVSTPAAGVISISVARDLYTRLGEPNFFNVMLGSGEHSGFVALIPRNVPGAASYKVTLHKSKRGAVKIGLSTNKIGVVGRKFATAFDLPFEVTEDGLILDIRPLRAPVLAAAE